MQELIPTYRIFKANGDWLYDVTTLSIALDHQRNGYTFTLLPTGKWGKK